MSVDQSKTNRLLSVEHNYCSSFWYSYIFQWFATIIGLSIQYCKIRLKMRDIYIYIYIYIQGIHKRMVRFQKLTINLFLTLHGHNVHLPGASFLNRARNSRCTVITDLDTSKRSTQKAFSCCDAILETGPAVPQ